MLTTKKKVFIVKGFPKTSAEGAMLLDADLGGVQLQDFFGFSTEVGERLRCV